MTATTTTPSAATMFEFRPEAENQPVPGIRGTLVFDESFGDRRLAVPLGRLKPVKLSNGHSAMVPFDDWSAQKIIWASLDDVPVVEGKVFVRGQFRRGRKVYVQSSGPGSKILALHTKTGLYGSSEEQAALLAQMPADPTDSRGVRRLIHPHGFYAMDKVEGAEHILGEEYDFDAELVRHTGGQSYGFYRSVPTELGEVRVRARREDTFNTKPGAQLLGSGCIPGVIRRVIHDDKAGYVVESYDLSTDAGRRWQRAFLETVHNRAEENRLKREAGKGATPQS